MNNIANNEILQGKIYSLDWNENIRQIKQIEEFRKLREHSITGKSSLWQDAFAGKAWHYTFCLRQVHHISDSQQDVLQICHSINNLHTGNN